MNSRASKENIINHPPPHNLPIFGQRRAPNGDSPKLETGSVRLSHCWGMVNGVGWTVHCDCVTKDRVAY